MLSRIAGDIKSLRIQGATSIAYAGLQALRHVMSKSVKSSKSLFTKELLSARKLLFNARPNEPMMFNMINHVINSVSDHDGPDFKSYGLSVLDSLKSKVDAAKASMTKAGACLLKRNSVVFTHCHSSSVMSIIKAAKPRAVYCTESRPRYQGRITAVELIKAGLNVNMIVDSAVADYVKKADYFLIGCDVITSTNIINKVGSRMISILCDKYDIPLYVCSLSYKFEPGSVDGFISAVEERNTKEVWDAPPRGLEIHNPAFDVVDFENITGFVTDLGVLPPNSFINAMQLKKGKLFD
jgi:ribose 1,5-bisphosphate isomerase